MKRMTITMGALSVLLLSAARMQAQGNLAQTGANFLQIAVEPRGAALGGAITADVRGAGSLYWNPSGAVFTEQFDLNVAHTNYFMDTKLMYGAFVKKFGAYNAVGVSLTSFYMDEMEITTVYDSEGTGEFFDAGDLALGLSYARMLTDRFTFGVTGKYIREHIWNETASQLALDVGSHYQTDFLNLRIGMVIRNFGGKLRFSGDDIDERIAEEEAREQEDNPRIERLTPYFRLPQVFQMGVAFEPLALQNNRLTFFIDVNVPSDNRERLAFAAEYGFGGIAYLRGGYRVNYDTGSFSCGGGLDLSVAGINAMLDYAYTTHGVLGGVHQFGFRFAR
ncbi:PorV/PorQ family protein [bacterium]|nr:PorV/PorQ family protein [bacterium]